MTLVATIPIIKLWQTIQRGRQNDNNKKKMESSLKKTHSRKEEESQGKVNYTIPHNIEEVHHYNFFFPSVVILPIFFSSSFFPFSSFCHAALFFRFVQMVENYPPVPQRPFRLPLALITCLWRNTTLPTDRQYRQRFSFLFGSDCRFWRPSDDRQNSPIYIFYFFSSWR